jgi:hypothetical protein
MPHYCRSPQAQELFGRGPKKFLTKGASYKPGNDNRFNMAGNRCRSLLCSFVSTGSQGAYYDRKIKGKY